jgi:hypothetical protein
MHLTSDSMGIATRSERSAGSDGRTGSNVRLSLESYERRRGCRKILSTHAGFSTALMPDAARRQRDTIFAPEAGQMIALKSNKLSFTI